MKEINLKLTVDDTNMVLNALGKLPFIQVQELIVKVQTQAQKQIKEDEKKDLKAT